MAGHVRTAKDREILLSFFTSALDRAEKFGIQPGNSSQVHRVLLLVVLIDQTEREARKAGKFKQGENRSADFLIRMVPASLVKHVSQGLVFLARKRGRDGIEREAMR